ncbi:ryncolin-2-like [Watersipora subatra]|uniref:ryncolin-2-like n=1 Tax=Watersipora subatra TaxID=2589382 RepID=UPI00355BE7AE
MDQSYLLSDAVSGYVHKLSVYMGDEQVKLKVPAADSLVEYLYAKARSTLAATKDEAATTTLSVSKDCQEHYERGATTSGVYLIDPSTYSVKPFPVWCDFLDGHGWTVFQKRFDGSVDFYQDWLHYKEGFGKMTGEYWLGLDKLHALTQTNRRLNILIKLTNGTTQSGAWSSFLIGSEGDNYKLKVSSVAYNGSLGESCLSYSNGMSFSTKDRDHDESSGECATLRHGAWWYSGCAWSNLNGGYDNSGGASIFWYPLYQLKESMMRVTRVLIAGGAFLYAFKAQSFDHGSQVVCRYSPDHSAMPLHFTSGGPEGCPL